MYVLRTQCIPILTYGAEVWRCINEFLGGIGVTFNNVVERYFTIGSLNLLKIF